MKAIHLKVWYYVMHTFHQYMSWKPQIVSQVLPQWIFLTMVQGHSPFSIWISTVICLCCQLKVRELKLLVHLWLVRTS